MNTNPNAKRILCFGDSYTWGYVPNSGHIRMPANIRRTGVLQHLLGDGFEIIEEGLNSRTLESDDPRTGKEGRNGSQYLIPCLDTHDPIDIVILMLGTNESKTSYNKSVEEIGNIFEENFIKNIIHRKSQFLDKSPKLLIISPPYVDEEKEYAKKRYIGSGDKLNKMSVVLENLAKKYGCGFINSGAFLKVGTDGVHIDAHNHRILAERIYTTIKEMM